jgi:hypothetical protein
MSEDMVTNFSLLKKRIPDNNNISGGIKPRKRWDNEGVASTVGTIMALMVFLAFLSMFTNQYVPVWMEENESSHMNIAYGQISNLKNAIDMQILVGTLQGSSPVSIYTPMTLGANGIPIFASGTPGYLGVYNDYHYNNISFSFDVGGSGPIILDYQSPQPGSTIGGTVVLDVPNRYYVPQTLIYENDAIILKQPDGEYMKSNSQLIIQKSAGNKFVLKYTQIDLRGDDNTYVGYGTRGIQTILKSVSSTTFSNISSVNEANVTTNLTIDHTTRYETAWYNSLNQTMSSNGMSFGSNLGVGGNDYFIDTTPVDLSDPFNKLYKVSLIINPDSISKFTLTTALIEVITSESGVS